MRFVQTHPTRPSQKTRAYNERMSGSDPMKPANPGVKLTYDEMPLPKIFED